MPADYPEIKALQQLSDTYRFRISGSKDQVLAGCGYYPLIRFELAGKQFHLFVDDEYDDLQYQNPLLDLCLVLRELEGYTLAPDYGIWCRERFFDPASAEVSENYRHLAEVYSAIKQILGEIDSQVSDYDFELNAGAAQALRNGAN